jgi:hypothetical protein
VPIFSNGSKNILFIHIPKSAGSSIERIGTKLGWVESFSVRGKHIKDLSFYKSTLQHLHAEPLQKIFDLDKFDVVFAVVRHPFYRLKSEYYWQKSQKITNLNVDEWVADTFERYASNSYIYDNHIRPQVDFIPEIKGVKVFKLEENGVKKAQNIFLKYSPQKSKLESIKKKIISKIILDKKDKHSLKSVEIEADFEKKYDKIFDFYLKDFNAFYKEERDIVKD